MPQFVSKYIDKKYIIGYTDFSSCCFGTANSFVPNGETPLTPIFCFNLFSILMKSAWFIPTRIYIGEQNEVSVAHQEKNCMKLFVATKLVRLSTIRSWWSSLSVGCGTGSFWQVRGSLWRRKIRGARGVLMATSRGGGGLSFLFLTTV